MPESYECFTIGRGSSREMHNSVTQAWRPLNAFLDSQGTPAIRSFFPLLGETRKFQDCDELASCESQQQTNEGCIRTTSILVQSKIAHGIFIRLELFDAL